MSIEFIEKIHPVSITRQCPVNSSDRARTWLVIGFCLVCLLWCLFCVVELIIVSFLIKFLTDWTKCVLNSINFKQILIFTNFDVQSQWYVGLLLKSYSIWYSSFKGSHYTKYGFVDLSLKYGLCLSSLQLIFISLCQY